MVDLNSDEVRADPYPAYAQIRLQGPAVRDESSGTWFVGRYEDVQQALKDTDAFSNRDVGPEPTLMGADGDAHRRMRRFIQPAFTPDRIASLGPSIDAIADEVVTKVVGRSTCEFMSEVAAVLPASVLAWMMGDEDLTPERVRSRADDIILGGAARLRMRKGGPGTGLPAGESAIATPAGLAESEAFLRATLERATQQATGGWVADLLAAEYRAGRISAEQFVDLGIVFIVGATETTTSLTGMAIRRLAVDPGLQQRLRKEPAAIDSFIEEALRHDAPVQRRPRVTSQATVVGGVDVPAGALVVLLVGSANRDPERFPEPDRFDVDRPDKRHLSFGAGAHVCPGSQLGRMEAKAVVSSVLRHWPPFRLEDPQAPVEQPANLTMRGPRRLPIAFDA